MSPYHCEAREYSVYTCKCNENCEAVRLEPRDETTGLHLVTVDGFRGTPTTLRVQACVQSKLLSLRLTLLEVTVAHPDQCQSDVRLLAETKLLTGHIPAT